MEWNILTETAQIEEIKANSFESPQLIFKHSYRCGVSSMALKQWERSVNQQPLPAEQHIVDVVKDRMLSRDIAEVFRITHESPQILLISNGKCIFNSSHEDIDSSDIADLLLGSHA